MALNGCHLVIARSFTQGDVDVDDEWCVGHTLSDLFVQFLLCHSLSTAV